MPPKKGSKKADIDSFKTEGPSVISNTGQAMAQEAHMKFLANRGQMDKSDKFLYQEGDAQKLQREFMARLQVLKDAYDVDSQSVEGLRFRNLMLEFGAKNISHLAEMMVEHQENTNRIIGISSLIKGVGEMKKVADGAGVVNGKGMTLANLGASTKGTMKVKDD
jgi:hypothetical protein